MGGRLCFFDAPLHMTEANLRDLFMQFGSLKFFQLLIHGDMSSRGIGMLEYEDISNLELVFEALNGFVLDNKALKVQRLAVGEFGSNNTGGQNTTGNQQKNNNNVVTYAGDLRSKNIDSISSRVYSNPIVGKRIAAGLTMGRCASRVVQLLNAVFETDLLNELDADEIRKQMFTQAS